MEHQAKRNIEPRKIKASSSISAFEQNGFALIPA